MIINFNSKQTIYIELGFNSVKIKPFLIENKIDMDTRIQTSIPKFQTYIFLNFLRMNHQKFKRKYVEVFSTNPREW